MMTRNALLCSLLAPGLLGSPACMLISSERQAADLDPDGDSVPWWTDCDSQEPSVRSLGEIQVFVDEDRDGYGAIGSAQPWTRDTCPDEENMDGLSYWGQDCNDGDDTVFPGATEACDGVDDNCDDLIDEGTSCTVRGERALTSSTRQVRGDTALMSAGWALAGGVDLNGDGSDDAAIASLGEGSGGGMVHLILGPLGAEGAFEEGSVQILTEADALAGSALSSPDARTLATLEEGGGAALLIGDPLEEDEAWKGTGEVWWTTLSGASADQVDLVSLREQLGDPSVVPLGLGTAMATRDPDESEPGLVALGAPGSSVDSLSGEAWVSTGAVYLFQVEAGAAGEVSVLTGAEQGDFAGSALAMADLDGDGCGDLAVGLWRQGGLGQVALVLEACALSAGETPIEDLRAALVEGEKSGDRVGTVLAASDDLTGDGAADLLVGAPGASIGSASGSGVVWLHRGASTVVSSFSTPSARFYDESSDAALGTSLTDAGDLDADGSTDLAIGAPGDRDVAPDAGAAWVVYGPLPMSEQTVDLSSVDVLALRASGVQNLGRVGHAVSPAGIAPDGLGDALLIGAPGADQGDDEEGVSVGRVFLFTPD